MQYADIYALSPLVVLALAAVAVMVPTAYEEAMRRNLRTLAEALGTR